MQQTQRVKLHNLETADPASGTARKRSWDCGKALPAQLPSGSAKHLAVVESDGPYRQTEVRLTNLPARLAFADGKGASGSAPLLDFPRGAVVLFGISADLTLTGGGGGLADDAAVEVAFGSGPGLADVAPPARFKLSARWARDHAFSAHGEPAFRLVGWPTRPGLHLSVTAAPKVVRGDDVLHVSGAVWVSWLSLGPF